MPHLTYQIQDGKQVLLSPPPYAQGSFVLPVLDPLSPWKVRCSKPIR